MSHSKIALTIFLRSFYVIGAAPTLNPTVMRGAVELI